MIETFDDARSAVADGMTPREAAGVLVSEMTVEERLWCLDGDFPTHAGLMFMLRNGYYMSPFLAGQIDRLGVPGLAFSDGPRGCVVGNNTAFPVSMARGATWDPDLEERMGEAIGRELRARGANLTGAVCVNVLRHPAWGRAQETYGEDPFHVGEMGAALTRGLQRHVMACVKHFACNSMENARFSVDITVDEVALHEVYLPHFRRIVDEGVASVMSAYNSVNGEWAGQNRELLTGILRDEWGFEGFVISDWILGLRDAVESVHAGLDVEMPYRMVRAPRLGAALESGEITTTEIDESVIRTLSTMLRFDDVLSTEGPTIAVIGCDEHRALAREVAGRSVVLLKNDDGLLPLRPGVQIAVIGRLGDTVNLGDGGSSDVWDLDCSTIMSALIAEGVDVTYDSGDDVERAAQLAAQCEVALVISGYTYLDEGEYIGPIPDEVLRLFPEKDESDVVEKFEAYVEKVPPITRPARMSDRPDGHAVGGDRLSLRLPPHEVELITAVAVANPKAIVAIQAASAVIPTEWVDKVPAVLQSWYGGSRAGEGLADVLFGRVNPSAKLPFSVPENEADLPAFDREAKSFTYDRWHGWWHLRRDSTEPVFPFGFGLSYSTFKLLHAGAEVVDNSIVTTGHLRNTGDCTGATVVQVYATLPDPEAPPRLVGFSRLELFPTEEKLFEIDISTERLAVRRAGAWHIDPGRYAFTVALHACDPYAITSEVAIHPRGASR